MDLIYLLNISNVMSECYIDTLYQYHVRQETRYIHFDSDTLKYDITRQMCNCLQIIIE